MSMSPIQIIGNLLFSSSYDIVVDQTQTGYIYFGMANPGTDTDQAKWAICRCKVTNTNKLNWFRWAGGNNMQFNNVWNSNGIDDVYNGTATF